MPNRSLWNWTLIVGAALAVIGVVVAYVLQATLPSSAINVTTDQGNISFRAAEQR